MSAVDYLIFGFLSFELEDVSIPCLFSYFVKFHRANFLCSDGTKTQRNVTNKLEMKKLTYTERLWCHVLSTIIHMYSRLNKFEEKYD